MAAIKKKNILSKQNLESAFKIFDQVILKFLIIIN